MNQLEYELENKRQCLAMQSEIESLRKQLAELQKQKRDLSREEICDLWELSSRFGYVEDAIITFAKLIREAK